MYERFGKKLYFNITWAAGVTAAHKFIPCTPFRPSVTFGDRYGSLLEPLAALTGNAPNAAKRANAVSAWFVPSQGTAATITSGGGSIAYIDFVAPTFAVVNSALVPLLPYLSIDGTSVARNKGKDTIYGTLGQPRHFSIRLERPIATALTFSGVLYVARQHSIEV